MALLTKKVPLLHCGWSGSDIGDLNAERFRDALEIMNGV